jgi:hypothetical protein
MAKLEKENNIKSIFYIRFDCDYYNPLSLENQKIIDFIKRNHEIGCHVDVTNIHSHEDLKKYLQYYNSMIPFNKFTFHINTEKTKSFGFLDEFKNKSVLDKEYVSDSKNSFTVKDFEKIINLKIYTLLIHPEWWDNEKFIFGDENGDKKVLDSLNLDGLLKKSIKEILG